MTQPEEKKAVLESPERVMNTLAGSDTSLLLTTLCPELLSRPHPAARGEEVPLS